MRFSPKNILMLCRLATKSGPLILIPYPVGTVDMG
jgi:hypothetical protein